MAYVLEGLAADLCTNPCRISRLGTISSCQPAVAWEIPALRRVYVFYATYNR